MTIRHFLAWIWGMLPSRCEGAGVPIRSWHGSRQMAFNSRKAAQVVAFFARERGGTLDVIEASKLVYLADREFMGRFGATISDDFFCNMEHGPVCSTTYDLMKGRGSHRERAG